VTKRIILAVVGGTLLAGLLHGYLTRDMTDPTEPWRQRTEQLLADSVRSRETQAAITDSLADARLEIQQLKERAVVGKILAREQKAAASALVDSAHRQSDPAAAANLLGEAVARMQITEAHLNNIIASQDEVIERLEKALDLSERGRLAALERVRELEVQLATVPLPKPCKIAGLIPCPSRGLSFAGGVVLGIGLVTGIAFAF
jgi:alkanesulfonate monooxygenase SsuD/methylene tetrahydromethanopterin reductase-like flavin-dependent oxidoreductase (luciferase family)